VTGIRSWWVAGHIGLILGVLATPVTPRVPPAGAQGQPDCQFLFGFAELRAALGEAVAGGCLENQRTVANGNAEQRTTRGLFVWRKADNWTAFTDGYRTWVGGPYGVRQHRNSELLCRKVGVQRIWQCDIKEYVGAQDTERLMREASPDQIVTWFLHDFASNPSRGSLLMYFTARFRDVINQDDDNLPLRMCLQNATPSFSVGRPVYDAAGTATVSSVLELKTPTARDFTLVNDGSTWLIDDIVCLK
jgi:hypothetical protein